MAGQRPGTTVTAIRGVTVAEAADTFLSSQRAGSPNTRRAYASVLDRLAGELGPHRELAAVPGHEIAGIRYLASQVNSVSSRSGASAARV